MMHVRVEINGVLVGFVSVVNVATLDNGMTRYQVRGTKIEAVGNRLSTSKRREVQHKRLDGALELAAKALRAVDKDMKQNDNSKKGVQNDD